MLDAIQHSGRRGSGGECPPHALVLPSPFVHVAEFLSGHRCDCSGGVGVSLQLSTPPPGRLLLGQLIAIAC
jgi:hypothetical protein